MRSAAAFLVVLFLFGCSQTKQEEVPVVSSSTVEQAAAEVKQEAAPVVQEVKESIAPETASIARPTVPETTTEGGDAVINAGTWGFSVYNPETKTTKYYTSNGSFLGKR